MIVFLVVNFKLNDEGPTRPTLFLRIKRIKLSPNSYLRTNLIDAEPTWSSSFNDIFDISYNDANDIIMFLDLGELKINRCSHMTRIV